MEVSIKLDRSDTIFTNGETIFGSIIINCLSTITVSTITASLIGESTSTLKRKAILLMNWKEEDRHHFVRDLRVIIPYHYNTEDSKKESLKLGVGYHSFTFALEVPEFPACRVCPPNSPVSQYGNDKIEGGIHLLQDLPPSMTDLVKGAEISYRIDVAVTTTRNMFRFTTQKSMGIKIWPIDTQLRSIAAIPPHIFPSTKSIQASILGPATLLPSQGFPKHGYPVSAADSPARILITAGFLPDFHLTRYRDIAMHLRVKKLHPYPHDLYLQSFQILLMGYTDIQVGTATSGQRSCWTIQSLSNLGMRIFQGREEDEGQIECELDPGLWKGKKLPDDVVPTFATCNLARSYKLDILMGFQCRGSKDQVGRMLFVQLHVPVRISSGIIPCWRTDDAVKKEMEEELSIALEDSSALDDDVLSVFEQRGLLDRDLSRCGIPRAFPTPPTYKEATGVFADKELGTRQG